MINKRVIAVLQRAFIVALLFLMSAVKPLQAQEALCATVRIEILQELTLERQGFDAFMRINNTLDTLPLSNVDINVTFEDENGQSVLATSDTNNLTAKFFITESSLVGIDSIHGSGTIAPATSAEIHWLIVPAPGAAADTPTGKLYMVGAKLTYWLGGREEIVNVAPDAILVKPLPELSLDYFLTRQVYADDPFTTEIEPPEPFTLGVRIHNNGTGIANQVALDTAQPTIVENEQNLLIDFRIINGEVNGQIAGKDLRLNFGDISPNGSAVGRWQMVTSLPGRFTEFTATVAHSDELGGQLTSLLPTDPVTHSLVHDVRVDLPGRDYVRDFLAYDAGIYRVYESNGVDTDVEDVSAFTSLTFIGSGSLQQYSLIFPPTAGFSYSRMTDPHGGTHAIESVRRSDGKLLPSENYWLSKERASNNIDWNYYINFFDVNSGGSYTVTLGDPPNQFRPPVWQPVAPVVTHVGATISIGVNASDADGGVLTLTAPGLPAGAAFTDNNNGSGTLTWSPTTSGENNIRLRASDGALTATTLAIITVHPAWDTDGDGMDDAWEMSTFGTLDRDGSGDFDGDGVLDYDEYIQWLNNGNNYAPVAVNDVMSGVDNSPVSVAVLGNDTDADGNALSISNVTQGVNGSVSISTDALTLSYIPNSGFTGVDSFDYTITDGYGGEATATVDVTINPYVENYSYYVLNPALSTAPTRVVSLVNGNTIIAGSTTLTLNRYEVGEIPALDLPQGGAIIATGPFDIASTADGTDMTVPANFASTNFIVPLVRDDHELYLLSQGIGANVQITIGASITDLVLSADVVSQFSIGQLENGGSARITSDQPILLLHTGFNGTDVTDAYPVPPVTYQTWGVRSADAVVGALEDNTTVYVYADDGSSEHFIVNAGGNQSISIGSNASNGVGSALHLVSDKPVQVTQQGDAGDGSSFFSAGLFGTRFGIPLDTQYLVVVCVQSTTQVTLDDGVSPQTLTCDSDGVQPGKLYFGSELAGLQFTAGTHVEASNPVFVMYETDPLGEEHNILGSRWSNSLVEITSPGDQSASEGDNVSLSIIATDVDSDPLTYSATGLPAGLNIDASGTIAGTLDHTSAGDYTVTVTVSDGFEPVDMIFNWSVTNSNVLPVGLPVIDGIAEQSQILTANTTGISDSDGLGLFSYQWQANGVDISGATGNSYSLTQADVGLTITLIVNYVDGSGTAESIISSAVGPVTDINDSPVGQSVIIGAAVQGQTLTVDISSISDIDGLGVFSYQWQANGLAISGATNPAYQLSQGDVGSTITVVVSYIDGGGTVESLTSASVGPVINTNDAPVGLPIINGIASQGQILTVDLSGISDADGLGAFAYQWQVNGLAVTGAIGSSYTLTQADVSTFITVVVSYIDGGGANEVITSTAVGPVTDVNDAPVGLPVINGTATQGQTLTVDNTGISDADGMGVFSYQWQEDGTAIIGATSSSFTLTQAHVGAQISVVVSYIDGGNTTESLTSPTIGPVTNTNDVPIGMPMIDGIATQGQMLTVNTSGISDADGLGVFSYQWQLNGTAISGATATTYMLSQAEVGSMITVIVSYTDGGGTIEVITSATVGPVVDVNDAPVGLPVINGTAVQGQILTADISGISDADGLGAFAYQWQANGSSITGAIGSSYTLTQVDVSSSIAVVVSYTDGGGTNEVITSAAVGPVTDVNDAPVGLPVINGTAAQGQTLIVDTTGISDADGLGVFTYQWQSNGTVISGATDTTYTLSQAEVGSTIIVIVSYTDGGGTVESLTSASVGPVTNSNDAPVGVPTIDGIATQGQILTINVSGITDSDGLGAFSYQWQSNGTAISGATATTFMLSQTEVGSTITVIVSYTDGGGTEESLTSASVGPVANTNDAPVGVPMIDGIATQGQILTVNTTGISDADGLGTFSYQWKVNNVDQAGATGSTYALTQAEVGSTMSVTISYTDTGGAVESLTSSAVGPVTDINDAPVGLPVINGTATQGQTLTADTTGISDADGLGVFSYQWKVNNVDQPGSIGSTYDLTQLDVGAFISVVVSYTDGHGTNEVIPSERIGPVIGSNNVPIVSILSPSNGGGYLETEAITLLGQADDVEDGGLSSNIIWISSIDGVLGVGATIDVVLSLGQHVITATISDSVGIQSEDTIILNIGSSVVIDTDNDGMDDSWEMTVIGSLASDGTGDFDSDGVTDWDEYLDWVANGYNFVPDAVNNSITTLEDSPVGVVVLSNDSDLDGDTLSIFSVTQGANGTVTISSDLHSVSYQPASGFTGKDSFEYSISDGKSLASATVDVTVEPYLEDSYKYYVLNPVIGKGTIQVVSLINGNTINAGSTFLKLDRHEVGVIPAIDLPQGGVISATGPFDLSGTVDGTDMLVPASFSALKFVVPLVRDSHRLYLLSPKAEANVQITIDGTTTNLGLQAANVEMYEIADDNTGAVVITSDQPLLVLHTGFKGGNVTDVYPVSPPALNAWGVRSPVAVVAAAQDDTAVLVYSDDGLNERFVLNAGMQQSISTGLNGANGLGSAIHVIADKPVLVTQLGNGDDGSIFVSSGQFSKRFGLPVDTQYLVAVCSQSGTVVTVDDGVTAQSQTCNSDGIQPGKLYFGGDLATAQFPAGTKVEASLPIGIMYESYPEGDEHNLMGTRWSNSLVQVNQPGDQSSVEGDDVNVSVLATDADNDSLTFTATGLPSGLVIDSAGVISGTLQTGSSGIYPVHLIISDGSESVTLEFIWSVALPGSGNNNLPVGFPGITGAAEVGGLLNADVSAITDADGLGVFTYQWQADGVDLLRITSSEYMLTLDDVGKLINVVVSYTDAAGTVERLISATVGPVFDPNRQFDPGGNQACFYTEVFYGGQEFCYSAGEFSTIAIAQRNTYRSVRVPSTMEVFAFATTYYYGSSAIYSEDTASLEQLNNNIEALKIYDLSVREFDPLIQNACFYTRPNYQGAEFCYSIGDFSTLKTEIRNVFQSLKVPDNVEVLGFSSTYYYGSKLLYASDSVNLSSLNQDLESLKVFDTSIRSFDPAIQNVCFYTQANYQGTEFCYGVEDYSTLGRIEKGIFQSMRIPDNVELFGFDNTYYYGTRVIYSQDVPLLSMTLNSFIVYDLSSPLFDPAGQNVCFYTQANYQGTEFCYGIGHYSSLDRRQRDLFQSVRVPTNVVVEVFSSTYYSGSMNSFIEDTGDLGILDGDVSSFKASAN